MSRNAENLNDQLVEGNDKKIHLVIVIDTLSGGGAEKTMLRLASTLVEMGNKVKFIVINPIVSHAVPDNIQLSFLYQSKPERGFKPIFYLKTARKLQQLLDNIDNNEPIDAVFSVLTETDRITQYLKKHLVFHCIRSNLHEGTIKNKKSKITRWLKKIKLRQIYKNKHMLFISKGAEAEVIDVIGAKPASTAVIYNPYPIPEIQQAKSGSVEFENYFIHVGRYSYPKRQDKLINIYAESGLKNPLILMGEGSSEETGKLKALIATYNLEDRIHLLSFQKNPFPYINNAIALLLTSDHESLSNVLIESLICGTPVIAYDCPCGPREILIDEMNEFLIPFDDSSAFIEKMKSLDSNRIKISAEKSQIKRFEAKTIAQQYLDQVFKIAELMSRAKT